MSSSSAQGIVLTTAEKLGRRQTGRRSSGTLVSRAHCIRRAARMHRMLMRRDSRHRRNGDKSRTASTMLRPWDSPATRSIRSSSAPSWAGFSASARMRCAFGFLAPDDGLGRRADAPLPAIRGPGRFVARRASYRRRKGQCDQFDMGRAESASDGAAAAVDVGAHNGFHASVSRSDFSL